MFGDITKISILVELLFWSPPSSLCYSVRRTGSSEEGPPHFHSMRNKPTRRTTFINSHEVWVEERSDRTWRTFRSTVSQTRTLWTSRLALCSDPCCVDVLAAGWSQSGSPQMGLSPTTLNPSGNPKIIICWPKLPVWIFDKIFGHFLLPESRIAFRYKKEVMLSASVHLNASCNEGSPIIDPTERWWPHPWQGLNPDGSERWVFALLDPRVVLSRDEVNLNVFGTTCSTEGEVFIILSTTRSRGRAWGGGGGEWRP